MLAMSSVWHVARLLQWCLRVRSHPRANLLFPAFCVVLQASACAETTPPRTDQFSEAAAPADPRPAAAGAAELVERSALVMGSSLHLSAWTTSRETAESAFSEVVAEFERLDALLSVWREGSDVLAINAAAGVAPVSVHPDTIAVLRIAQEVSEWTDGKFDITFGALADVWKFDHDQDNVVPSSDLIAARLPLVDYRQVEVSGGTAFIRRKGMRLHLGGIGKGFAVDRGVEILRRRGLRDFMIQSGGDLYVGGRRGDRPWRLGINDPRGAVGLSFATVELSDATFSTSGDYERYFFAHDTRYHHILDPDEGMPARGCRSVTVVSKDAVHADGLSTGVFILGPEKGMALIERLPDVEAVIVTAKNDVLISSGLRGRVTIVSPPIDAP